MSDNTSSQNATGTPCLPTDFSGYTRRLMGDGLYSTFTSALRDTPPVSIRVNPRKCSAVPSDSERVPWCGQGHYLASRPVFTFDPLLHAGWYYVQEASSMFVWHVLRRYVTAPARMLDLCAAPGGKSTAALAALPAGSTLMTNEPVRQRAQILAENIQKWGDEGVIVTNNYPRDYARSGLTFDVILCDVPCSGEGMFRKDEGAVAEWSAHNVEACGRLQREIVAEAWHCLRPGGLLIYSTCTFNAKENEDNVRWIVDEFGAKVLPVDVDADWGIQGSLVKDFAAPVYRFIPGCAKGEGLFCAVLRKDGEAMVSKQKEDRQQPRKKSRKEDGGKAGLEHTLSWVDGSDFVLRQSGDTLMAIPERLVAAYDMACGKLKVLSAGVILGHIKGRDVIPDQPLALSSALRRDAFPMVEVDYANAIAYLRRDTVTLPDGTPRGFVIVTYHGAPLGFVKNIGTRANNLYPQEWKIKSTHVPEEPKVVW